MKNAAGRPRRARVIERGFASPLARSLVGTIVGNNRKIARSRLFSVYHTNTVHRIGRLYYGILDCPSLPRIENRYNMGGFSLSLHLMQFVLAHNGNIVENSRKRAGWRQLVYHHKNCASWMDISLSVSHKHNRTLHPK